MPAGARIASRDILHRTSARMSPDGQHVSRRLQDVVMKRRDRRAKKTKDVMRVEAKGAVTMMRALNAKTRRSPLGILPAATRQQRMQLCAPQHDKSSCKSSIRPNAQFDVKVPGPSRFGERNSLANDMSPFVNPY